MIKCKPMNEACDWFIKSRLGMFIHWGLYALPARHEWYQSYSKISAEKYRKYFEHFNPDLFNPNQWADIAAEAGMKYFVVTAKHHEGFCLWDSKLTDYKATNTPFGRDALKEIVDAFKSRGLKVGIYYSLLDWHHPHFTIDDHHPLRDHPGRKEMNKERNQHKYIEYLHGQIEELLTRFDPVEILWLDFTYPPGKWGRDKNFVGKTRDDWDAENLVKLIRRLAPRCILNDRLDFFHDDEKWDIRTPEQFQPRRWVHVDGKPVFWEACHTFSGSWGYHRDENSWKSNRQIVQMLIDNISKGGNMILNVGPTARGQFDLRAMDRLTGLSQWMKLHDRSIYGCTQAPKDIICPPQARLTYNPETNRLYVHIFDWPLKYIHIEGLADKVEYAQMLHDGSEVPTPELEWLVDFGSEGQNMLNLELPEVCPDVEVPVVEIFLKTR